MTKLTKAVFAAISIVAASQVTAARAQPKSMTISTASPGGVYAVYGEGLAKLITERLSIPTSTRQTQGPAQNLMLLMGKSTDLALVTTGPAYEAMSGKLELAPGEKYKDLRVLFAMYPTPFQMVSLKANDISSLDDLNHKRVGAGPRAGTGGQYWSRWLPDLGIDCTLSFGGIGDQMDQLADGRLDAIVTAGGIPHPSIVELETTKGAAVFGMSQERLKALMDKNPYAVQFTIPKGTYKSQSGDIETVAMWNFVAVDASMPDDIAYEITKAVFENHDRMVTVHATARDTLAENIANDTFVPLHPGAARYYKEIGTEIPAAIAPKGQD